MFKNRLLPTTTFKLQSILHSSTKSQREKVLMILVYQIFEARIDSNLNRWKNQGKWKTKQNNKQTNN